MSKKIEVAGDFARQLGQWWNLHRRGRTIDWILMDAAREDLEKVADDWMDKASEAALDGNPQKAQYFEHLQTRLQDPTFASIPPEKPKSNLILPDKPKKSKLILPGE